MSLLDIHKTCFFIITLFSFNSICLGQNNFFALKDNQCYVVIGAFNLKKNASAFANSTTPKNYGARYRYNSYRHLYYVYTYQSKDREAAKSKLFEIRERHPDMRDSWLYAGNFNGPHITSEQWAAMLANNDALKDVPEKEIVKVEPTPPQKNTFKVYLNAIDAKNSREIAGKFKIIDLERDKEHSVVPTQKLLTIKPENRTNRIKFVSDIIGFQPNEYTIDLDDPLADSNSRVEIEGDTIIIDFQFERYEEGDVAVLWKVYFYKDAAIMKTESIEQLSQLLKTMRSNQKMRIRIHGHTNGTSRGKAIHLDPDSKAFFSLEEANIEAISSAKNLSRYRAYTVQQWLMNQGISEDRMEIIGWGGKKMIHDKYDSKAHENVRVEIEVLETS